MSFACRTPKLIRQIHVDYREAGADVLTTNTFGANRRRCWQSSAWPRSFAEILHAGARIAREVADEAGPAGCSWPARSARCRSPPQCRSVGRSR